MNKLKVILSVALVTTALLCGGCAKRASDNTSTVATPTTTAESMTVESLTAGLLPSVQNGENAESTAKKTADTQNAESSAPSTSAKAGQTKANAEGTTGKETVTLKDGKPVSTTKAVKETTTKATAQATTQKTASTTKASSEAKTTKASSEAKTTKASDETTTAVAKGSAVTGKLAYLKDAPADTVQKLTAKQLTGYGITGELQNKILQNPENWTAYKIQINFTNKEDVPVTLYNLTASQNGKNNVYINGSAMGELGLPVGGKMSQPYYVIAPSKMADEAVLNTLLGLQMQIQYAATPYDDSVIPSLVYAKIG